LARVPSLGISGQQDRHRDHAGPGSHPREDLQPAAQVGPDVVELLIDGLPETAARFGQPAARPATVTVTTEQPPRRFVLATGGVSLEAAGEPSGGGVDGSIELPAEVLLRLVYGRLQASDPVRADGIGLDDLHALFVGL
jgi:hypothetical protein